MPTYGGIQKEETLKGLVHDDYFPQFGYEPNIGNIDFVLTDKETRTDLFSDGVGSSKHYLWAEAKKGAHDVFDMFTQLILTCKKTYEKGEHLAPPWLGCFDEARIAFVSFSDMLPIFTEIDFNWNQTPSSRETADFQKAREKVTKLIGAKIAVYAFGADDRELKEFVKTHFAEGAFASIKSPITKDNFVQIFIKWVKEVKPFINIPKEEWAEFKNNGILDCDFFRADMMSENGNAITITEKLKIILEKDNYKLQENIKGRLFQTNINFTDGGAAYSRFWNRYERPPAAEYQQHIVERRDLLVPQNIREVKGSFFTPKIWADKSKEYTAKVFGENWQDEYYVWDCAAGTGNLLAGLSNEYNVWASDVEQGNVETMQSLIDIDENLNLLSAHVFQFDFLNDSFDKLPEELKKIIGDPEKRKKLIVYINPPYAESSGGEKAKTGVSTAHKTHSKYISVLGKAANELFSQFIARAYNEISGATLALFSTLKYLNSSNFQKFRSFVKADYKGGFMCLANTFDNVHGNFPIGFLIWHFGKDSFPKEIRVAVLNIDGTYKGLKSFYNGFTFINDWISKSEIKGESIGTLYYTSNDFQQNNLVYISLAGSTSHLSRFAVTKDTLIKGAIYFTVRHVFEHTWINHNDQFLYPNDGYKTDIGFQNDCLIYTLFHGKNNISVSSVSKTNHWIPFTEKEVGAREKFESAFMSGFLKGKTFSAEAAAVLDAGRELWKHYHAKTKDNLTVSHNASFYDIQEYFQGRKESGAMNTTSTDETYTALLAVLRGALKTLAAKIQPKVYEYGFLKELGRMLYRIQQKYDVDHLLFPNLYRLSCPEDEKKSTLEWLFDKYKKADDTYEETEEMNQLIRTFHFHAGKNEDRLIQITNFYPILLAAIHCCYALPDMEAEQAKAIKNFCPRSKFFQECFLLRDDINVLRGYIFGVLNAFKDADWAFFQHYGYKTPFLDLSDDLESCKKGANYNGKFNFNDYYLFEINETLYEDFMRSKGLSLDGTILYRSMYIFRDEMKNIDYQNKRIVEQKGIVVSIPPQGRKFINKELGIQTSGYFYNDFLEIFQDIETENFSLYPVKISHIVNEIRTEVPRLSVCDLIISKGYLTAI